MNSYVNNVVEAKGRFSLVQHIKMSVFAVDKSTANDVYDVDCVSANSFGDTETRNMIFNIICTDN